MLLESLLDGDEVLEALRHLETLDVEVPRVQEVIYPLPAVVLSLRLHTTTTGEKKTKKKTDWWNRE